MSAATALLVANAAFVLCGLGVVALLGLAPSAARLAHFATIAPLAGIAWVGAVASTCATFGVSFGGVGLAILTAGTLLLGAVRVRRAGAVGPLPSPPPSGTIGRLLGLTAAGVLALVGLAAFASFRVKPLVEYDGWAIWGMKAQALAALGSADPVVFASAAYERLHLEYPILLPSLNAISIQIATSFSSTMVVVQALVLAASGVLAFWGMLRDVVRPSLLLPALAAIAASPAFLVQLGSGYADVPLAVFVAAGLTAAARWLLDGSPPWLLFATLFLGAATLTKNEGLLFAACAYVSLLLAAVGRRRAVLLSALIVAAVYAPWRLFTARHGLTTPDYDLGSSFDASWVLPRLDRLPAAAAELVRQAVEPRHFTVLLALALVASVLALFRAPSRLGVFALTFGALSLAGLTWVYVLTPYELSGYMATNANRVIVSPVLGLAVLSPLLVEASSSTREHPGWGRRFPQAGASARWWGVLAAAVIVTVAGTWVVSPRFDVETPSVVDDWYAISRAPDQVSVDAWLGNAERQRFRPGWILWNDVQWHTLDAPDGMVGPNAWNVVRIFLLVLGLCLATALAMPPPRTRRESVLLACLSALPALLVVGVPAFALDLARFGPQEPVLIGGMALGGSLLVLAAQRLLDAARPLPRLGTVMLALGGIVLWLLGVYQKEASLCAVPLLAAAVWAGRRRARDWARLNSRRKAALVALGALIVLPLVHVAFEVARIARSGDLVYGTEVDGGRGAVTGLVDLVQRSHEALPARARLVVVAAVVLTVAAFFVARVVATVAAGALLSAALVLLFAGQAANLQTRYYMPVFALAAAALAMVLGSLPRVAQVGGLVVLTTVALLPLATARQAVETWAGGEREWGEFVQVVTSARDTGCPVAIAGFDVEASEAVPVLVALGRRAEPERCPDGGTYLVVGPGETGAALLQACAADAVTALRDWPSGSVYQCGRLASKPVDDPEFGGIDPAALVQRRRLTEPRARRATGREGRRRGRRGRCRRPGTPSASRRETSPPQP